MARAELNFELRQAAATGQDVVVGSVKLRLDSGTQLVRLTVKVLEEGEPLAGLLLVVFEDQPAPRPVRRGNTSPAATPGSGDYEQALEKELHYTRHRLQTTIEDMESSVEEL